MTRFTTDNTEGYTATDLAHLNADYAKRMVELAGLGADITEKSLCDHVAERVLADFDSAAQEG